MKITRSQLKKLVMNERFGGGQTVSVPAHQRGELGKNIADLEFPILVGYEGKSEITYTQDELDELLDYLTIDNDIPYSLDSLADVEVKDLPAGAKIEMMESAKISKARILSIIKESVQSVAEQVVGYEAPKQDEEEEGDTSGDWVQTGAISGAAPDSSDLQTRIATSARQETQQRQQDLDKGDAVDADEDAEELQGLIDKHNAAPSNEAKYRVKKSMLLAMIRESLLLEQDSVLIDYVKEEIANSNDPEPGIISREELTSRSEGAGYKGDDIDEAIASLLEDGEVTEDEEGILKLQQ
tara:strand:+ start:1224 stop:2114 length:891 start_codon:yes stop_codon:yes gene_type:complete